jgi:hypothetical protein
MEQQTSAPDDRSKPMDHFYSAAVAPGAVIFDSWSLPS